MAFYCFRGLVANKLVRSSKYRALMNFKVKGNSYGMLYDESLYEFGMENQNVSRPPHSRMWSLFPRWNISVSTQYRVLKEVLKAGLLHPLILFDLYYLSSVFSTMLAIVCKHSMHFPCVHRTQPSIKYYCFQKDNFSIFHGFPSSSI